MELNRSSLASASGQRTIHVQNASVHADSGALVLTVTFTHNDKKHDVSRRVCLNTALRRLLHHGLATKQLSTEPRELQLQETMRLLISELSLSGPAGAVDVSTVSSGHPSRGASAVLTIFGLGDRLWTITSANINAANARFCKENKPAKRMRAVRDSCSRTPV